MIISKSTEQFRPFPFVDNSILPSKGRQRNHWSDCGVRKGGKLEEILQELGNFWDNVTNYNVTENKDV